MVDRPHKPSAISAAASKEQHTQAVVDSDGTKVTAKLPTGQSVEILLHGATVLSWQTDGQENLFLSKKAALDGSKPVRGGIPVVFPVFGPPPKNHATSALPQHGFARNSKWEFLGKSTSESGSLPNSGDDSVKLDFGLGSSNLSADARQAWPYDFSLVYSVTLSRDTLSTIINVRNEGQQAFDFQFLLHTYWAVKDIGKVRVKGLGSVTYVDKVLNATEHQQSTDELAIAGEVDRVYRDIKTDTTSILEDGKPRLDITRDNLADTVVWNPWTQKAAAMSDFAPDDAFTKMICVEVGCVSDWVKLESGDTFEAGQVAKAAKL